MLESKSKSTLYYWHFIPKKPMTDMTNVIIIHEAAHGCLRGIELFYYPVKSTRN